MRQRKRHEQVIGIASSGIEYEMTREREPPPSYRRTPRRFIKLTAHATPSPPRPSGRIAGRGNGKRGGPPTDETSGTQNPASHHPPASDEQADEEDGGAASTGQPSNTTPQGEPFQNSERARARERHGKEASRQTVAMLAAANRQQPTPPTPRGRGNNSSRQSDKSEREGVGREEKDIPHLYRSRGTLRIYPIQSQLRNRQASRPWVGIEKYDDEKNRPRRSQRKEKTKERAGAKHPQALSEGGNKQLIAKNHSKKRSTNPG